MIKKIWIWPALALVIFIVVEILLPKPINWTPTYSRQDKNPYGSYALAKFLPEWFSGEEVTVEPLTFYELDSLRGANNFIVVSGSFSPADEDADALLNKVAEGSVALIASERGLSSFWDTLGIKREFNYTFEGKMDKDSVAVSFTKKELPAIPLPNDYMTYWDSLPANAEVLAKVEGKWPVLARIPWGNGEVIVSTMPKLFTNYYLIPDRSRHFAELAVGYMPDQPVFWTEYYHMGRMEAQTPLRFILGNPALRWAYYLGITLLFAFILFGIKRRQRAIPIMLPPANTSLQFADSLGRLYYRQKDHLDLAGKRLTYLMESLRERYGISVYSSRYHQEWVARLAGKSGRSEEEIEQLLSIKNQIENTIDSNGGLSEKELLQVNSVLEKWNR
jgi:hypothetical protein